MTATKYQVGDRVTTPDGTGTVTRSDLGSVANPVVMVEMDQDRVYGGQRIQTPTPRYYDEGQVSRLS